MKPKKCLIFNPSAKGEKANRLLDEVRRMAKDTVIKITSGPGDAEALAERAVQQGYETILAAGGDGTVNEVVNGIGESGVTFGILPVGTMNVFALELGIPSNLKGAWEVIQHGHIRDVDMAKANDQYFVQLAGVGIDAQVVSETDWEMKKSLGPLSYVLTGLSVAGRKPPVLRVTADRHKIEGCFVLVGNGRYYGGPIEIFKGGRIDDGLLDVYVFQRMSHFDVIRYLHGAFFQAHDRLPDVKTMRVRRVTVESDDLVPVEVDGELLGNAPVTFQVLPGKLRVLSPNCY